MVDVFSPMPEQLVVSNEIVPLPSKAIIQCEFNYQQREFVKFPKAGISLSEQDGYASTLLFDGMGKFEIAITLNGKIEKIEDVVDFGSCSLYWLEGGKNYQVKILVNDGLFEIYVDDVYLQTFNNARLPQSTAKPFSHLSLVSLSGDAKLSNLEIYEMNL